MMRQSQEFLGAPRLDYEAWRDLVRALGGRFNPEGVEPSAFTGWVRPISFCGFTAAEVGLNARRVERTYVPSPAAVQWAGSAPVPGVRGVTCLIPYLIGSTGTG